MGDDEDRGVDLLVAERAGHVRHREVADEAEVGVGPAQRLHDQAHRRPAARAGRPEAHPLALEIGERGDPRPRPRHHGEGLAKEAEDRAQLAVGPRLRERRRCRRPRDAASPTARSRRSARRSARRAGSGSTRPTARSGSAPRSPSAGRPPARRSRPPRDSRPRSCCRSRSRPASARAPPPERQRQRQRDQRRPTDPPAAASRFHCRSFIAMPPGYHAARTGQAG